MTCLDARRALSTDPRRLPAQIQSHVARCQECLSYQATMLRMDEQVADVLRRPTPEGLQERLLLAHRLRSNRWRLGTGIAALVLIGLMALLFQLDRGGEVHQDWSALMTEHLLKDPIHDLAADPEAAARFRNAVAEIGLIERGTLPAVRRAGLCVIGGQLAVHVVFELEGEPVVVFLLPQDAAAAEIHLADWTGEVRSMNGGAVGLFTRGDNAMLAAAMGQLEKGLSWRPV